MNILLHRDVTADTSIYTDGSAFSNPSRGGFASVILQGSHQHRISGGFLETTSMRMEWTALEYLTQPCNDRLPVSNHDLWRRFQICLDQHQVRLVCIASRSPDLFMRFVHLEAGRAALRSGLPLDPGFNSRLSEARTGGQLNPGDPIRSF